MIIIVNTIGHALVPRSRAHPAPGRLRRDDRCLVGGLHLRGAPADAGGDTINSSSISNDNINGSNCINISNSCSSSHDIDSSNTRTRLEDRGPLFPGSSCFPLSPDRKHRHDSSFHTRGSVDQLNVIFELLGTPSDDDVASLQREESRKHIRACGHRAGKGIRTRFPHAPAESLDIIESMLKFMPRDRVVVSRALEHPLFSDIRDPSKETTASGTISLDFDRESVVTETMLRQCLAVEIGKYHQCRSESQCVIV